MLERVGLENLIKERQMIRQMREQYQGRDAKMLPPMMFAGIIMEGGIVGYDSNTLTGGSGVRLFGIGGSTQYQSDTVTVTLRTVSVSTGEILTTVTVTKTVLSYMDKITLLRFVGDGTTLGANANALEGEIGGSINESINKAIDVAVQAAVIQTINEGARKGHWAFKSNKVSAPTAIIPIIPMPTAILAAPATASEIKSEPKVEEKKEVKVEEKKEVIVEEKKDVMVQSQTKSETETKTVSSTAPEVKQLEKLPSEMILKEAAYIYKEPVLTSQKTWMFKKGTLVIIVGVEGDWIEVRDLQKRKGFVKKDVLANKP